MDAWQAALLGLVEGLTEYLPVSSTGHLLLTQRALGIAKGDAANAFAICIQSGAILAVFALYRARLFQGARGLLGRDPQGARLCRNLAVAFLPAAVIGKCFDDRIESVLFGLWPVVAAWFVGGCFLLWLARRDLDRTGLDFERITWITAALIGLCQCAALWPGISRSLATIAGGLLCGLSLAAAIEFSFLLGLLTLGAATAYKAVQHGDNLIESFGPAALAIGVVTAFVSAWLSVRWMVRALDRRRLAWFGYYRMVLAVAVAALLAAGWIEAN